VRELTFRASTSFALFAITAKLGVDVFVRILLFVAFLFFVVDLLINLNLTQGHEDGE
jgi:hypothetical protein